MQCTKLLNRASRHHLGQEFQTTKSNILKPDMVGAAGAAEFSRHEFLPEATTYFLQEQPQLIERVLKCPDDWTESFFFFKVNLVSVIFSIQKLSTGR